jgi:hypothetical protein
MFKVNYPSTPPSLPQNAFRSLEYLASLETIETKGDKEEMDLNERLGEAFIRGLTNTHADRMGPVDSEGLSNRTFPQIQALECTNRDKEPSTWKEVDTTRFTPINKHQRIQLQDLNSKVESIFNKTPLEKREECIIWDPSDSILSAARLSNDSNEENQEINEGTSYQSSDYTCHPGAEGLSRRGSSLFVSFNDTVDAF